MTVVNPLTVFAEGNTVASAEEPAVQVEPQHDPPQEPAVDQPIRFRCPHRAWVVGKDQTRDRKAALRRNAYEVPGDTKWRRVDHDYNPNKSERRKVLGKIVEHKPYEHELGHTWEAEVTCPDCGDTVLISTDQDPGSSDVTD